jgi:hypothetical protein
MRNALVAYDDQTQLALARQDALVAAANATIAWARSQISARPPRTATTMPAARAAAAAPFSISPIIDAARSAGDAGMVAARGARSMTRVITSSLTAVGSTAKGIGRPLLRVLPPVALVAAIGAGQ